ncbi:MAG: PTS sugar transporter subunit IIB [Micrococcaceae bacterium]
MKNVLFICSGGMSSAIVEKALNQEAQKQGVEINSEAVGTGKADDAMASGNWDIVLVAPQVKHRYAGLEEAAKKNDIPIALIQPRDYSPLGGPNLLKLVTG